MGLAFTRVQLLLDIPRDNGSLRNCQWRVLATERIVISLSGFD